MCMIHVVIVGYGAMGKQIEQAIHQSSDMHVEAILHGRDHPMDAMPHTKIDAIIDFSHPDNQAWLCPFIKQHPCAYICGTTGLNEQQVHTIEALGKRVPIVLQANFSLGIAIMQELLKKMTPHLMDSFDIEIVEKHHNQKQDAPSGTAQALLETINPKHAYEEVYGRHGFVGKRGKEIGIHAIRGGSVAGEHSVLFLGDDETIELKHTASSRKIFVNGALFAARFAIKQKPGMYTMNDILWEEGK